MSTPTTPYDRLIALSREVGLLGSVEGLLGSDQETMMPSGGAEHRARQLALIARLRHERLASSEMGDLLGECEASLDTAADTIEAANVRALRHDHDRAVRLPAALVEEIAATASTARHAWAEARTAGDFARFRPWLEKTVDLCHQKAACYGWADGGEPSDALAEDYEPGCTVSERRGLSRGVGSRLRARGKQLHARRLQLQFAAGGGEGRRARDIHSLSPLPDAASRRSPGNGKLGRGLRRRTKTTTAGWHAAFWRTVGGRPTRPISLLTSRPSAGRPLRRCH